MTDKEMILKSCIFAVSQMLEKGKCIFVIKDNDKIYKIDYAEVYEYLRNALSEMKGSEENGN